MYWQREVLRNTISMTFNQTWEFELPKTGILGSLIAYVSSTENAQPFLTAVKWRLIDYISKIEIIGNGSTVIKSYDGRQAIASAFHDDLVVPTSMWCTGSNVPHRQFIPIHFGLKLKDELRGLDLSRFNQVTIKITNDATATEFTTDIKVTLIAYWIREPAAPVQGYLREEVFEEWDPVAASVSYHDMPTELPIRRILLRARPAIVTATAKNASSMINLMSNVKYTHKTGQMLVFEGSLRHLGHLSILEMGKYVETMTNIERTDEYGYEVGVGYVEHGVVSESSGTATPSATGSVGGSHIQDSAQEVRYRAADQPLQGLWRGFGFMHNVPLFMTAKPDLSDLLDPDALKTIKVDVTCASGTTVTGTDRNAKNAIVLSRLVK